MSTKLKILALAGGVLAFSSTRADASNMAGVFDVTESPKTSVSASNDLGTAAIADVRLNVETSVVPGGGTLPTKAMPRSSKRADDTPSYAESDAVLAADAVLPEPGSMILLGSGLIALGAIVRRFRAK